MTELEYINLRHELLWTLLVPRSIQAECEQFDMGTRKTLQLIHSLLVDYMTEFTRGELTFEQFKRELKRVDELSTTLFERLSKQYSDELLNKIKKAIFIKYMEELREPN